jgi:nucleoid-associated protein YgaU
MDQSVKIAMASGVLLGGILLALLFRRESSQADSLLPETGDRLVLREYQRPPEHGQAARQSAPAPAETLAPQPEADIEPRPTVVRPMAATDLPPALAKEYPARGSPPAPGLPSSIGGASSLACPPEDTVRMHRIVDGDTLPALAARYLGSADRYLEIYEANREALPSPSVLPIGAELRIVLVRPAGAPAASLLVPIPRQADPAGR